MQILESHYHKFLELAEKALSPKAIRHTDLLGNIVLGHGDAKLCVFGLALLIILSLSWPPH